MWPEKVYYVPAGGWIGRIPECVAAHGPFFVLIWKERYIYVKEMVI